MTVLLTMISVPPRADRRRRLEIDDIRPPRQVAAPMKRGPKPKPFAKRSIARKVIASATVTRK